MLSAFRQGTAALEALRRQHPDYIDLNNVLEAPVAAEGPESASLSLTLQSLTDLPLAGTEYNLGKKTLSASEAVHTVAVDALVRSGTREAAEALLEALDKADGENRKWVARGLQRLQMRGLAAGVAACRDQTREPYIWLMLLIAEVRQHQEESMERIAFDLNRLQSKSEALLDALSLYLHIHQDAANIAGLRDVIEAYVERVGVPLENLKG